MVNITTGVAVGQNHHALRVLDACATGDAGKAGSGGGGVRSAALAADAQGEWLDIHKVNPKRASGGDFVTELGWWGMRCDGQMHAKAHVV